MIQAYLRIRKGSRDDLRRAVFIVDPNDRSGIHEWLPNKTDMPFNTSRYYLNIEEYYIKLKIRGIDE